MMRIMDVVIFIGLIMYCISIIIVTMLIPDSPPSSLLFTNSAAVLPQR